VDWRSGSSVFGSSLRGVEDDEAISVLDCFEILLCVSPRNDVLGILLCNDKSTLPLSKSSLKLLSWGRYSRYLRCIGRNTVLVLDEDKLEDIPEDSLLNELDRSIAPSAA